MLVQIRSCHKLPYGEKPPGGVPSPARHGAGAPSPGFPRRVLTRAEKSRERTRKKSFCRIRSAAEAEGAAGKKKPRRAGRRSGGSVQHGRAFYHGNGMFYLTAQGGMTAHFAFHGGDALDDGGMLAVEALAYFFQREVGMLAQEEEGGISRHHEILPAGLGGKLRRREVEAAADEFHHVFQAEAGAGAGHVADDVDGHFFRNGVTRELRLQHEVVQAAFQKAHVAGDAVGQKIGHAGRQNHALTARLFLENMQARVAARALHAGHEAGTEAGNELGIHPRQIARSKGAGEHHAAAVILKVLDGGKQLLLRAVLAAQKMHVFQKQHVQITETFLELVYGLVLHGLHELRGEFLGREVFHAHLPLVRLKAEGAAYGLGEMRFAQPRARAQKHHVHRGACGKNIACGGIGYLIAGADHEIFKRVLPALHHRRVEGAHARQGNGQIELLVGHEHGGRRGGNGGRHLLQSRGTGQFRLLAGRGGAHHHLCPAAQKGGGDFGNGLGELIAHLACHEVVHGGEPDFPLKGRGRLDEKPLPAGAVGLRQPDHVALERFKKNLELALGQPAAEFFKYGGPDFFHNSACTEGQEKNTLGMKRKAPCRNAKP